jgi:hypothetical protein
VENQCGFLGIRGCWEDEESQNENAQSHQLTPWIQNLLI